MIQILVCTNRENSLSEEIAYYYQKLLLQKKQESNIISLKNLPEDFTVSALYNNAGKNPVFNLLRDEITKADKIVMIVPEYNGSFPGVLKAFIDGLPYPNSFLDKKIALVGLSAGVQGGALALSHLGDIFAYLNANVLGTRVKLMQIQKFFKDNVVTNDLYNQLLNEQIDKFIAF